MTSQPRHENRYCRPCRQTIRHERRGDALVCERCQTVQRPPSAWAIRTGQAAS
jgi:uncharacterized paraquat-inducible protein A